MIERYIKVLFVICFVFAFYTPTYCLATNKLIFIHHSTGGYWLGDASSVGGGLGETLDSIDIYVRDINYPNYNDDFNPPENSNISQTTDIGHWWSWFSDTTVQGNGVSKRDNILDGENGVYKTNNRSSAHGTYTTTTPDPGGENNIIMIKSCYPASNIYTDNGTTFDQMRGRANNYSIDGQNVNTVSNVKSLYNDILEYFKNQTDKMFIISFNPPLLSTSTTAERAANARLIANWLQNEWLQSADWENKNVYVFDQFNVLTHENNRHTFSEGQIVHYTDPESDNYLVYPRSEGNNHPSGLGHQKATADFVPLLQHWVETYEAFSNKEEEPICEAMDGICRYVSLDGSDSNDGSFENPWLTVEQAWASAENNDIVYYRAGTYTITTQINNLTSGANVTHANYQDETVTWESSLCANRGVIMVSENNTTIDGINGNWTGAEYCFADTGFFVMGWSSKPVAADYFTLKNGEWSFEKYGQNGGIVFGRRAGGDAPTHVTVENVKITGPGVGDPTYGSINCSGIMMFEGENWTIKNSEISNVNTGIFFNKHANAENSVGGIVQNNYIYNVGSAVRTQTNHTTFINNIFDGSIRMGYDSGLSADGNRGSDHNTWIHNTFMGSIQMERQYGEGDNELHGTVYPVFENNIMPEASVDIHRYGDEPTHYRGDYNLWPTDSTIWVWDGEQSTKTLGTFQTFLGGCPNTGNECNSIEQNPTFVGGTTPSVIADFALTSESYGYQSSANNSDIGANTTLVGVGFGLDIDITPPSAPQGIVVR